MLKAELRIKYNDKSFDKTFNAKPNEDTDAGAIQEAAIYFYGVEHEFLSHCKPNDTLLMSVFDTCGRIIINGYYASGSINIQDLRK